MQATEPIEIDPAHVAPDAAIRQYLEYIAQNRAGHLPPGFTYTCPADWLLTNGRFWTPPTTEPIVTLTPQACFDNAFKLASRSRGRYRYVEGVALSIIPVDHAWCVDAEDRVIDPTWGEGWGQAYFGAVFDLSDLKQLRRETRRFSILGDYVRDYPLLRQPRPTTEGTR